MKHRAVKHLSVFALVALLSVPAFAGDIVIFNVDPPGVGFNDPTPVVPVGGNPGTTLGQQRLNVFQFSADLWESALVSAPDIIVQASFSPLSCTPTSGTLGSAGPFFVNFFDPPAPPGTLADTWYVIATFNAIVGFDVLPPGFPHIGASFNGDIGTNPNCLTGRDWYNGLDGNQAANEFDLLVVVTHEIGHGLGFLDLVSLGTGEFFLGLQDIYATNLFDLTQGKFWNEMTDAERLASTVNDLNLVWGGPSVDAAKDAFLGPKALLRVDDPKSIEGDYEAIAATYGPAFPGGDDGDSDSDSDSDSDGVEGDVVLVDDGIGAGTDGCESIVNDVAGKIALIDRGTCAFVTKTLNAQAAGAEAVIIANNVASGFPSMGGTDPTVNIVSIGVTQATGDALKGALAGGGSGDSDSDSDSEVEVEFVESKTELAGTQNGLVRMFAPNPPSGGSSTAHWDVTNTPSLLMEPFITPDLLPTTPAGLDLTPFLFEDIDWTLKIPSPPATGGGGDDDDSDSDSDSD